MHRYYTLSDLKWLLVNLWKLHRYYTDPRQSEIFNYSREHREPDPVKPSSSERNHACSSSKHVRICLACKMRSGRSNSHPPDCESCLMSRLPTCWRVCKLPHCAIDPGVAFWYHYLRLLECSRQRERRSESWWCTTRDELGCRTAEEDCCRQKGIHRKKLRELSFSV